jgi:6,7-dimethyl-8-ribityllumazine synthase
VAHGLARISVEFGKPAAFGVLTCQTLSQAQARCGGAKGNKGEEAMRAAIGAAQAIKELQ